MPRRARRPCQDPSSVPEDFVKIGDVLRSQQCAICQYPDRVSMEFLKIREQIRIYLMDNPREAHRMISTIRLIP
jgi:hypothetical protein